MNSHTLKTQAFHLLFIYILALFTVIILTYIILLFIINIIYSYDIETGLFTTQPLSVVLVLLSPLAPGWVAAAKVCLSCISETVRCRKLILNWGIGWGCSCATSWSDLDLILSLKNWSIYISETVKV